MKKRFETDGVKPPRDCQKDYLNHLSRKWLSYRTFAGHMPPGYGKTYIAKAIQLAYGPKAMVITVSNHLLDQYLTDYPETNSIKGRTHYKNVEDYRDAFKQAETTPSIANPLSYYYGVISGRIQVPEVLIIDEAHKLYDTMFLTSHLDLPVKNLGIPEFNNMYELAEWTRTIVQQCEDKLTEVHRLGDKQQNTFYRTYERLSTLLEMVKAGDHTFTYEYAYAVINQRNQKVLRITPTHMTRDMFWPFLQAKKLILISGTFTRHDLKFYSDSADYYTGDYLTRPENREIKYEPIPESQRKCPETIAAKIKAIYEAEGRPNTLVHVTYSMAETLRPLLPEAITHNKLTKTKAIERFRHEGGILLASGCAEGIDLPDDICRLVIIPTLLYPNLGDDSVRKRRARVGGPFRYNLDTMMTTVQQLGRGTRHAADQCKSYILDPMFSELYSKTFEHLPNDLNIDWTA